MSRLRAMAVDTCEEAVGRQGRIDPVRPGTGGPAGNAALTAWTGLVLLVLFLAELVTLLDVHGLLSWHIALGALLIPPALLKTATTGWRIARYYSRDRDYVTAGPPPTPLRFLGPVVVLSTLAVLGTGVALILVGESTSRRTLTTLLGQRVDALTLHQASFILWAVATGLHVLARLVPAVRTVLPGGPERPGRLLRVMALGLVALLAALTALLLVGAKGDWRDGRFDHRGPTGSGQLH